MPVRPFCDIVVMTILRSVAMKQSALSGGIHKIVCMLPAIVNKKLQGGRVRNRFIPNTALPDNRDRRI